jgi:hypothetical protein
MSIFDSLPFRAVMHGFVGIRTKNCEILPVSTFGKTVNVGMIGERINNKVKSENCE